MSGPTVDRLMASNMPLDEILDEINALDSFIAFKIRESSTSVVGNQPAQEKP